MARWTFAYRTVFPIILIILTIPNDSNAYLDNLNVPCKYLDSINITNGIRNTDDDSIMFDGITYPKTLHTTYDYAFINESYRQPEVSHERGCICDIDPKKPCVRLCCPRGQYLVRISNRFTCSEDEGVFNMSADVYGIDGFVVGNVFDFFNYVLGQPCASLNMIKPVASKNGETWKLLKNGHIMKNDPQIETLDKNHYCLTAMLSNDSFETALVTCSKALDETNNYWASGAMFLNVPFLLATIVVYIILPELRNIHGKSLVCYLSGLVVGYTTLGLIKLNGSAYVDPKLCRTMGYATYSAFLYAFFWTNVISFDLWRSFRVTGRRRSNDSKKFAHYSIYASGSTIAMLLMCVGMDYNPMVSADFKPAIGIYDCFLGHSKWSQFLYFYLPITIIMISNLIFFVSTSWKIIEAQMEIMKYTNFHLKTWENCSLFLRLFTVMGITWSIEPIALIVLPGDAGFYSANLLNAIQGALIFLLLVVRVGVMELMVKRWQIWRGALPSGRREKTTVNAAYENSNIWIVPKKIIEQCDNET